MDCDSKITNTGVYGKSLWQLVICYTVTIVIVLELAIMCGTDNGNAD